MISCMLQCWPCSQRGIIPLWMEQLALCGHPELGPEDDRQRCVFTLVAPQPPKTRPSEPVQYWYKKHNNLQLAFTRDEDYKTFNCTYNEANTCGQLNMRWLSCLWVRDFMMSNKESCSQHDESVGVFTVRVDVAAINNSVWIHLLTLSFVQIIVLFVVIIQCFVSQTFYSISCSVLIE